MKVVYITGVSGFLGSHLARALVRQGWEVHGLKRSSSDLSRLKDIVSRIIFHDVDCGSLDELFGAQTPDAVVHLATDYGRNQTPCSQLVRTNTLLPLTLLELAVRQGVPTFINADTCYTIQYRHLQAYTLSKHQFVEWGKITATERTRFINLKLYHPYGPGDGPSKFVPQMIRNCLESTGAIPLTLGEQRKDFINVKDVIGAMRLLLAERDRLQSRFVSLDCGSGCAVSIREFVETVHRLTRSRAVLRFGALPYRENEIMISQADPSVLLSLGWRPSISLEQGIEDIVNENLGSD